MVRKCKYAVAILCTLSLAFAFALFGCGRQSANQLDQAEEAIRETISSSISTNANEISDIDVNSKRSADMIDVAEIEEVSAFSDGVAWVETNDASVLINNEGNVLFERSDTPYADISHYCNGGAAGFVNSGAYNYLNPTTPAAIVDKDGKTVWSIEEDGQAKAEEIYGEDAVSKVGILDLNDEEWRGYLIVVFEVDTFEYTGALYGIVDASGKWVVEPPQIKDAPEQQEPGIYQTSPVKNVEYSDNLVRLDRQCVLLYRTGEILPCTGLMYGDGYEYGGKTINQIKDEEDALAHRNRKYDGDGEFIDVTGAVSLDINALPLTREFGGEDGNIGYDEGFDKSDYCIVHLTNQGGGQYFTVIDINGNQMFDPKKDYGHGILGGEAFYYVPGEDEEGYYIKVDGTRLGNIEGLDGTAFEENRAWLKVDGEWRCLDEKGEIVF